MMASNVSTVPLGEPGVFIDHPAKAKRANGQSDQNEADDRRYAKARKDGDDDARRAKNDERIG